MKALSTSCGHMLGSWKIIEQRLTLQGCSPAPPAADSAACIAHQWAAASACMRRSAALQVHGQQNTVQPVRLAQRALPR